MSFNFKNIDVSKLKAGRINLGSEEQDCAILAKAFEHACHYTASEAAALAPISRQLSNTSNFSGQAKKSLSSYLMGPQLAAKNVTDKASQLSSNYSNAEGNIASKAISIDELMSGIKLPDLQMTLPSKGPFGGKLAQLIKECTPCATTPLSFIDLNPIGTLLSLHESFIKRHLALMSSMIGLLNSFRSHGDLCSLIDAAKGICIVDLQRMLLMLMAKLMFDAPKMDGMIDLLQQLIAPLFMGIMQAITTLMDQMVQLVTAPAQCIIDNLNAYSSQLSGLGDAAAGLNPSANDDFDTAISKLDKTSEGFQSSIDDISKTMAEAKREIEDKLDFYIEELEALKDDSSSGNANYLGFVMQKIMITRQIAFIKALIMAKMKGASICKKDGKSATKSELDNFFNNFLNPLSPYKMWLDDNGKIRVSPVDAIFGKGNPLVFNTKQLLDSSVQATTTAIADQLNNPPEEVIIPCSFSNAGDKAKDVNEWIREMNSTS